MNVQLEIPFVTDSEGKKLSGSTVDPDTKMQSLQRFCARASVTPSVEQ